MSASAERLMEVEQYEDADESGLHSIEEVRELYEEQIREIAFEHVSFRYPNENGTAMEAAGESKAVRESDIIAENSMDPGVALHTRDILQDVSFSIAKGDYVAVTGTSGCGKSTMLKLLMGIYRPQTERKEIGEKDGKRN